MQKVQATLPVGTVIHRHYIVEDLLSQSGSGAVYLVKDQRLKHAKHNLFALKEVIALNKQEWHRFILYDVSANVSTSMSLAIIRQSQGKISGYLKIGPELQGSGPFSGTINAVKNLQFIITDAAGHPTIYFEGVMQSATSLSGDFYQCGSVPGNQCSRVHGSYGIWNVILASPG